jgi:hypothetical protein
MQISRIIMENSMEIPQKTKDRMTMRSSETTPAHLLKRM